MTTEDTLLTELVVDVSRYACPVCGDAVEDLAAKKAHIKRRHPKVKKVRRG